MEPCYALALCYIHLEWIILKIFLLIIQLSNWTEQSRWKWIETGRNNRKSILLSQNSRWSNKTSETNCHVVLELSGLQSDALKWQINFSSAIEFPRIDLLSSFISYITCITVIAIYFSSIPSTASQNELLREGFNRFVAYICIIYIFSKENINKKKSNNVIVRWE